MRSSHPGAMSARLLRTPYLGSLHDCWWEGLSNSCHAAVQIDLSNSAQDGRAASRDVPTWGDSGSKETLVTEGNARSVVRCV